MSLYSFLSSFPFPSLSLSITRKISHFNRQTNQRFQGILAHLGKKKYSIPMPSSDCVCDDAMLSEIFLYLMILFFAFSAVPLYSVSVCYRILSLSLARQHRTLRIFLSFLLFFVFHLLSFSSKRISGRKLCFIRYNIASILIQCAQEYLLYNKLFFGFFILVIWMEIYLRLCSPLTNGKQKTPNQKQLKK